jgi:hypothetical protein
MTVSSKRKTKAKSLSKTKSSSKSKSRKNVSKTKKMHGGVKTYKAQAQNQTPKFNLLPTPISNPKLKPKWFHRIGASLGVRSSQNIIKNSKAKKKEEFQRQIQNEVSKITEEHEIFNKNKSLAQQIENLNKKYSQTISYMNGTPPNKQMQKMHDEIENMKFMHDQVFQRAMEAPSVRNKSEYDKLSLIGEKYIPFSVIQKMRMKRIEDAKQNNINNNY